MGDVTTDVALDIFNLPDAFTEEQLRAAYKHVSLAVHPDRGGSADMFNLVKQCFDFLTEELAFRRGAATHFDMRQGYGSQGCDAPPAARAPASAACPTNFDLSHFNSVFDDMAVDRGNDPYSRGYGDLNCCGDARAPVVPVTRSPDKFNEAFVRHAKPPGEGRALVVDPRAGSYASARLQFTELGVDEVDDFSTATAGLEGFDCKLAYAQESMAAHHDAHRDAPVTLDRAAAQRASDIPGNWQELQAEHERRRAAAELETERRRREIMLAQQRRSEQAYARANRLLIAHQ